MCCGPQRGVEGGGAGMKDECAAVPGRPWIGPACSVESILVLGESWYGDYTDDLVTDHGDISAYLRGTAADSMYTRMANACGQSPREFWNSILFTNFVWRVGSTRSERPTPRDYGQAAGRLERLVEVHRPTGAWISGIEQAQFSAPVVDRAQIAHEVTAHPTSRGLTNKALGSSRQALLWRVRTDAAVLPQHPERSPTAMAARGSSRRCLGVDLIERKLEGHAGIMSADRDPQQRRGLSTGYGGAKASSSTWRSWRKTGAHSVWIMAAPNDLARFEQCDCDVFYEGDRVVSATTRWDATWQTLAYFYGHLIRKTPAPPLG